MSITKTKAATDCHIKLVMGDPDYIKEHNKIINDPDKKAKLVELLKEFGLELEDFEGEPNNGLMIYMNPDMMFSAGRLEHDPVNREFVATFNEGIRKEQFMELWTLIQKNKIKKGISKTKHKPPQQDTLLYAIFKARMVGRTFREIFEDYSKDTLANYKGKSISQFHSEDELEKYYRKFYKTKL